ncbi:DUF3800 domain-containing protein [Neptunomonas antarctica]|uniref:DUF3800 domain-containing protein n=1 Tax=Neptunomonas antarctica TaxID=619304 RepID=A0A1N7LID8_9GAMM|nr:DUF3800 domain-containing protein [Neptunomonas antarctica]SIS73605.1 hypothetical protein SAMN05421760_10456 [Neptunomonas antarctica]
MNIYIDDSIHEQHGFMLLSFVICNHDPQDSLQKILSEYDLKEFHSCEKMKNNAEMQEIRSKVRCHINDQTRWGVFVLPSSLRHEIFEEFSIFISHLESLALDEPLKIFVDQGIISDTEADLISSKSKVSQLYNCDSSEVNGIQLADLVAALCGVRLREEVTGEPKMLTYGDEDGYNPPIEAELGYELWASLRYSMYRTDSVLGDDMPEMATFNTIDHGFLLSKQTSELVREKASKIFGEVYLGCIH